MKKIATVYTDFNDKFGLPRQAGLVEGLTGCIVMEKEFRRPEAFRELEGFSHIWLLWLADKAETDEFQPTVRPPRLGGNRHVGVFASRSPFRPNSIGLSAVKLLGIDYDAENGPILYIDGIDMLNGTPVLDIKPYIKASDCIPAAISGYAEHTALENTEVIADESIFEHIPEDDRRVIIALLKEDPTPRYIDDEERIFGFKYGKYEIKFSKSKRTIRLISVQ